MATTVRVRDEDKAALDTLQARYTLASGERISLEELMSRIVALAEEHEDELLLKDDPPHFTPEQVRAFFSGTAPSGSPPISEEDIDRVLYGGEDAA